MRTLSQPPICPESKLGITADRKLTLCPTLHQLPTSQLITNCSSCSQYFLHCCAHTLTSDDSESESKCCHHFPLMFTSACTNNSNGQEGPRAGVGCTAGTKKGLMWGEPVSGRAARHASWIKRLRQRAEVLGAIEGVARVRDVMSKGESCGETRHGSGSGRREIKKEWVVVTDSEYVVKGMTELFPAWRRNNWHDSSGKEPPNLDLFRRLHAMVDDQERELSIKIGFWLVDKRFNLVAEELAREAARRAQPVSF